MQPKIVHPAPVAIAARGLVKVYPGGKRAVDGLSLEVRRGEVFGILGPNGAGKSTTIGMLGTLVRPTAGMASVLGLDIAADRGKVRAVIGFAMQDVGVDPLATGREFLAVQGALYGLPRSVIAARSAALLRLFQLEDAADRRIKTYSGGMQRRIDLAAALLHEPPLLFLDEPTEGLDPRARQRLWETLLQLRREHGTTIVLSTHYMEEAERLCDRLAIVDGGRIVAQGTPAELKAAVGTDRLLFRLERPATASQAADVERRFRSANVAWRDGRQALDLRVKDGTRSLLPALQAVEATGLRIASSEVVRPTLDDVYLGITGRRMASEAGSPEATA